MDSDPKWNVTVYGIMDTEERVATGGRNVLRRPQCQDARNIVGPVKESVTPL